MKTKFIFLLLLSGMFATCQKDVSYVSVKDIPLSPESPKLIWSNPNQPNPSKRHPVIFYSPHQDDESLGMGASIAHFARLKRPVYVVLMTSGALSKAIDILNGKADCAFHKTTHDFNLSEAEFVAARNAEFIAACKALGVHRIYIANAGKGFDETKGLEIMVEKFKTVFKTFNECFSNASHKIINGSCDYTPKGKRSVGHRACAIAMQALHNEGVVKDVRMYKLYLYYFKEEERDADVIHVLEKQDMTVRNRAYEEYKYFNPAEGRYAIGYTHSVYDLFENSRTSDKEYIDYPKKKCE